MKGKEGGGPPGFDARERKSFGALPRVVHGRGKVAAGGRSVLRGKERRGHGARQKRR